MAKKLSVFQVDTEPTKEVVVVSLTKDISIQACILDLIDNSIDAARNKIYEDAGISSNPTELPESYKGYKISLTIGANKFAIEDNCGGISKNDLQEKVLRFGEQSAHNLGIGIFGVGLNRALFKLGKISTIYTDTGSEASELTLDADKYLRTKNSWLLDASIIPSSGKEETKIEISAIPTEISRFLGDKDNIEDLKNEISWKYARFIDKGLTIKVNKDPLSGREVNIRTGGPYPLESKRYTMPDGVIVDLEFGQHDQHRFTAEPDYNRERNEDITDEFGWSVYCNDRAILLSDRTWKTGWEAKFHTEFYGFVGTVRFISNKPDLLPWNTTKSDVDLNNKAYQMAIEDMRRFAEKWRRNARDAKNTKKRGGSLSPAPKPAPKTSIPSKKPKGKEIVIKPTVKPDRNQFRTVLPEDINEVHCFDKHLNLVHEAKKIDLGELGYSGLALIRMLFEISVLKFTERHNISQELKDFGLSARRKKGVTISTEEEKKFSPSLEEMIGFLEGNPTIWGANKHAYIKSSLKKLATYKPLLNGVVHNAYQQVSQPQVFQIRDESLPVLRHLIEY
jgi:hypothetical protein